MVLCAAASAYVLVVDGSHGRDVYSTWNVHDVLAKDDREWVMEDAARAHSTIRELMVQFLLHAEPFKDPSGVRDVDAMRVASDDLLDYLDEYSARTRPLLAYMETVEWDVDCARAATTHFMSNAVFALVNSITVNKTRS